MVLAQQDLVEIVITGWFFLTENKITRTDLWNKDTLFREFVTLHLNTVL